MALKLILESLDGVQEAQQALYAEHDGKFMLQIEGVEDHPEFIKVRETNKKRDEKNRSLVNELKGLNEKLSAVPEDFNADEWARLRAEDEGRKDDPEGKDVRKQIEAAVTAARQQETTKFENAKKKLDGELDAVRTDNQNLVTWRKSMLIERDIGNAMDAVGIKPEARRLCLRNLLPDVELIEEDGKFSTQMKSDLGGDPVETYLRNLVQTEEGKLLVKPQEGSAAPGSQARGHQTKQKGSLGGSREERSQAIASKFPELAKAQ